MNWYKQAQFSKKLLKNIEKKKNTSIRNGWSPEEVEWAARLSTKLNNPSYFQWLLQQTRNGSANIQTGEDDRKIYDALHLFHDLKNRKRISEDINQIPLYSDLYGLIQKFMKSKHHSQSQDIGSMAGVTIVYQDNLTSVLKVDDPESGSILFSDSGWCVKDKDVFTEYKPPFYNFRRHDKNYALYSVNQSEFKNIADITMSVKETVPLCNAIEYLINNGTFSKDLLYNGESRIMSVVVQEKNELNQYAEKLRLDEEGNPDGQAPHWFDLIHKKLSENLEYANLIENFNMSRTLYSLVDSAFSKRKEFLQNEENSDIINTFYNSIPRYLDQNKFQPTDKEHYFISDDLLLEGRMSSIANGAYSDEMVFEKLEQGVGFTRLEEERSGYNSYYDELENEFYESLDEINNLYRSLHKYFKTKKNKEQVIHQNNLFFENSDDVLDSWEIVPNELKKEVYPSAKKALKRGIMNNNIYVTIDSIESLQRHDLVEEEDIFPILKLSSIKNPDVFTKALNLQILNEEHQIDIMLSMIEKDPDDFEGFCPENLKNNPDILQARKKRWIDWVESNPRIFYESLKTVSRGKQKRTTLPDDLKNDPDIQKIINEIQQSITSPNRKNAIIQILLKRPYAYDDDSYQIPDELKRDPDIFQALKQGWINHLKDEPYLYSYHDFTSILRNDPDILAAVKEGWLWQIELNVTEASREIPYILRDDPDIKAKILKMINASRSSNWYKKAQKTKNELIDFAHDIANKVFALLSRSEKEGSPISDEEAISRVSQRLNRVRSLTDVEREEILTYARLMVEQTFGDWKDYGYVDNKKNSSSVVGDCILYYSYEYDHKNNKLKTIDLLKATSADELITDQNLLYNLYIKNEDIIMNDIKRDSV